MIGEPFAAGVVHDTTTALFPATAFTAMGASGAAALGTRTEDRRRNLEAFGVEAMTGVGTTRS